MFTVLWARSTLDDLARIRAEADDSQREIVRAALREIGLRLRDDPDRFLTEKKMAETKMGWEAGMVIFLSTIFLSVFDGFRVRSWHFGRFPFGVRVTRHRFLSFVCLKNRFLFGHLLFRGG